MVAIELRHAVPKFRAQASLGDQRCQGHTGIMPLIRWLLLFQTFCTTFSVKYLEELTILCFGGL